MGAPVTTEFDWTLDDGTQLLIRPIRIDDKALLSSAMPHISPDNLYRRFFMPVLQLSDDQLRFLTEIDQKDHIAWCAISTSEPGRPLAGVARCIRIPEEPAVAEAAILVVDRYQLHGLGTLLLAVLSVAAENQGIASIRSYTLVENTPFMRTMQSLGAVTHWEHGNVQRIELPVYADTNDVPDTPRGRTYSAALTAVQMLIKALH